MTFTDDELKRLKDLVCVLKLNGICADPQPIKHSTLVRLLARLEAAERIIEKSNMEYSHSDEDCHTGATDGDCICGLDILMNKWRKAAGK